MTESSGVTKLASTDMTESHSSIIPQSLATVIAVRRLSPRIYYIHTYIHDIEQWFVIDEIVHFEFKPVNKKICNWITPYNDTVYIDNFASNDNFMKSGMNFYRNLLK